MCMGVLLGVLLGRALAEPPARVTSVQLDGAPLAGASASLDALLGRPATPGEIAEALRALEQIQGSGNFDVDVQTTAGRAAVKVVHYPQVRHVGEVAAQVDGEDLGLPRSRALMRRVDVRESIFLSGGRRFHPYLLTADRAALTRWYRARGYRDVALRAALVERQSLVDVGWQIRRGHRYVYAAPRYTGLPKALAASATLGLRVRAEKVASVGDLDADRARIAARLCAAGYPRAAVEATERVGPATVDGVRPVLVEYTVDLGPRIKTGAVQVAGRYVPQIILATLPLKEGDPYCPAQEEEARALLVEFLRDAGVPDPQITAHRRTWLRPNGSRVLAVTFDVRRLVAARVERIWFVGNQVTSTRVLRQLTTLSEGDGYRQSLVDESVQAMRRSGLFQRVAVDIVEGATPDRVSLRFRVTERPPFRVDPVGRSVTLYNLDVAGWPEDFADLDQGFAFRGEGQRLDLFGQTEALGFRWFHGFLGRYLISTAGFRYRTASTSAFEDTWILADLGIGLKDAANTVSAMLIGELHWIDAKAIEEFPLGVLDGSALAGNLTLQAAFDFTRRNDERIQYLGLEGRATLRSGNALTGEALRWFDHSSSLKLHLPLWRTERGQHWVLRLGVRDRAVVSLGDAALPGHLRQRPSARGYASGAHGVLVQGPDPDEAERFGALHASDASLEVRIPLPVGRRNAITPFLDAAAAADTIAGLKDDARFAVGLAVSFSLFDERIEGVVWGAWPFEADTKAEYVGGGFGGGF